MKQLPTIALALTTLVPLAVADPATAQETEAEVASEGSGGSYAAGFAIYQRYCRSCHGDKGKGDGHVAKYLKVPPTDLTRLAAENGGEFPAERVRTSIDGREEMVGLHGRDMPIWGAVFEVDGDTTEADVARKLDDLVAYVRFIQVGDEAEAGEPEQD